MEEVEVVVVVTYVKEVNIMEVKEEVEMVEVKMVEVKFEVKKEVKFEVMVVKVPSPGVVPQLVIPP